MKPLDAYWQTVTGKTFNHRKIGNHFGTVDLGIQWNGSNWSYFLYRQNIYETGSLFRIINFTDGLGGLSIKRKSNKYKSPRHFGIHSFLLEVVGTKDQMNKHPFSGLGIFETGNYFNHYIYANGWSYFGRNMGTPLIGSKEYIKTDSYRSTSEFTNNNRLWAFHGGMTSTWLNVNILLKATYSRNFGTYISPFEHRQDQLSFLVSAERKLPIRSGLINSVKRCIRYWASLSKFHKLSDRNKKERFFELIDMPLLALKISLLNSQKFLLFLFPILILQHIICTSFTMIF